MTKNILRLFIFALAIFFAPSCKKDFLDKAPGVDIDEDFVFSSKVQLDQFIANIYRNGIHSYFIYDANVVTNPRNFTINSSCTDESKMDDTFFHTQAWNSGTVDANRTGQEDYAYPVRFVAIRNCYTVIDRIKEVPNLEDSYRSQVIGEMKFIIASNYLEMFRRYGGVPIVTKRFTLDEDTKLPRNSVEEVVNFIVKNCDEAIDLLPSIYPTNQRGRVTKTAAQMLKSRILLYAASPLFNSATPYLDFGANNKLICYGNEDKKRWQLAADAAKVAIDDAIAGNFALITDKGTDKNYKFAWEQLDNPEIVLASKLTGVRSRTQFPWYGLQPWHMVNSWGGPTVLHNFVRKYEKKDGTPQTWPGGSDLSKKYAELDPRFAQTVGYNGSYWNIDHPILETFEGGKNAIRCYGGAWMKKNIPDILSTASGATPNAIVYRLAEAYLNYAEALNEAQGPVAAAYEAANIIRSRSGMPDLPSGLTQAQFRERIQNERAIELAFEDHRLYDIRRWKIAEQDGVMTGPAIGLKITKIVGSTDFKYETYTYENRVFNKRMYLHPFYPQTEVLKGYLVQNPGY
jgi:starch-binding outer membrane protein, SusD/RagB family